MTRDEALADLAASINGGEHGSQHLINGRETSVVMRSLSVEEVQSTIGSGSYSTAMPVEGCRITMAVGAIDAVPLWGESIDVDGVTYTVAHVARPAGNIRLTLTRYAS